MKNMLGIKRLSAALLIGTMVGASSTMRTNASNPQANTWETDNRNLYAFFNTAGDERIQFNPLDEINLERPNSSVWRAVGDDAKGWRFFEDEREISQYTSFEKVKRNLSNNGILLVTNDRDISKDELYEEIENETNKIRVSCRLFNDDTGESSDYTIYAHPSDMLDRVLEEFEKDKGIWAKVNDHCDVFGNSLDNSLCVGEAKTDECGPVIIHISE